MKHFSEKAFESGGLSVLDYFSDKENQESLLQEVKCFGDKELSGAFQELFSGYSAPASTKKRLKRLFEENNQRELVRECIAIKDYTFIRKILKKKDVDWYAERIIAETGERNLIDILLTRSNLGWATQSIIAESGDKDLLKKLLKGQRDLSPHVKDFVVENCDDESVILLISTSYLPFEVIFTIVKNRSESCIKEIINKYHYLPDNILLEIIKLHNDKLSEKLLSKRNISDEVSASIVETGNEKLIKKVLNLSPLGPLTQKAIIKHGNAEIIRVMMRKCYLVPNIKTFILETLNPLLIKEFIGTFKGLSRDERNIVLLSGNKELISLLST